MSDTIVELFKQRVNEFGPRPALMHKYDDQWKKQSWKEWWEQSERIAAGLIDEGLEPGDSVGILSDTRIEWAWIDMAAAMAGGVATPIYPSNPPAQCGHILRDADTRFVFVEDPGQLDKLVDIRADLPGVDRVVYLDRAAVRNTPDPKGRRQVRLEDVVADDDPWVVSFDVLAATGRRQVASDHRYVADRRRSVEPTDLATISYTAGASGSPRGVEHTHAGLVAEVEAMSRLGLVSADDRQLLFLPLAHGFAHMLFLTAIKSGMQTAFAEGLPRVFANLGEVQPTVFAGVPRIFDTLHTQLTRTWNAPADAQSRLFRHAVARGKKFSRIKQRGDHLSVINRLEQRLYERMVFKDIRRLFGGQIRLVFCGGAPLRAELAEFFHAAGILILEGYGLTETAAVSTLNLPDDFSFGSVGKPLPGVDVTIGEDGQILVGGPMVATQDRRVDQAATEAVDSNQHWLRTGDLGCFDRDGFLHVRGRKDNVVRPADGQPISPEPLERRLGGADFIKQAIICGDDRPYLSALVTLDEAAETWAIQQGIAFGSRADLTDHPRIRRQVHDQLEAINDDLPTSVSAFEILPRPLTVDDDELTPTGKVRRHFILSEYADLVDSLYPSSSSQKI